MLPNLPESYLSSLLPRKVVALDERGLLQAFISGYQDRVEDIRAYVKKFNSLLDPAGLGTESVVLVTLRSPQGLNFLRTLDVDDTTPDLEADLPAWATLVLAVEPEVVISATFGQDLLRESGAGTLYLLASTVGALLHQGIGTRDVDTKALFVQFLQTYFARLKVKGTARSFEALGYLVGFDEVAVEPLWGRLSPRIANDAGDPRNDGDFSPHPDFSVRQALGLFYDPHDFRDGPFFEWSGTVSPYLSSSDFYSQVVNGFNPWVRVALVSDTQVSVDAGGTYARQPVVGLYPLAGGSPHTKASVTPAGTGLRFEALAEGDSFNGLAVQVQPVNGTAASTPRRLQINDRLSSIKYRTSYYDLGLAVTEESSALLFGTGPVRRNAALAAQPTLTSDGTAVSPYRPWAGGTVPYGRVNWDYVSRPDHAVVYSGGTARQQAARLDVQLDDESLFKAVSQAGEIFDEVRPATRQSRRTLPGYVFSDSAGFAPYRQVEPLFAVTVTGGSHGGFAIRAPSGSHAAQVKVFTLAGTESPLQAELLSTGTVVQYSSAFLSGTHNLSTNQWQFTSTALATPGDTVALLWSPTTTEIIRLPEPVAGETGFQSYQAQPVPGPNHTQFVHWTVPDGYQVDLLGSYAGNVYDDIFPGNGVYAALSGQDEFGLLVSREEADWVSGVAHTLSVEMAGNHRLSNPVVAEIRFAGTSFTASPAYLTDFTSYSLTWTPSTSGSGPVEVEMLSGVVGAGPLLHWAMLTKAPSDEVVFYADLNDASAYLRAVSVELTNARQVRAEDEQDAVVMEVVDDVPWRRDLVLGGELEDANTYVPFKPDLATLPVVEDVSVQDQNGVEYRVYSIDSVAQPPRIVSEEAPLLEGYQPGKVAIGYRGEFKSLSAVSASFWETGVADDRTTSALLRPTGGLFSSGGSLYHVGLVSGVLIADALRFNSPAHRDGLAQWLTFNEHPEDDLQVADRSAFRANPVLDGVIPDDRQWDAGRGWSLRLRQGASLASDAYRELDESGAFSLWLKAPVNAGTTAAQVLLSVGDMEFGIATVSGTTSFGLVVTPSPGDPKELDADFKTEIDQGLFAFVGATLHEGILSFYGSESVDVSVALVHDQSVLGLDITGGLSVTGGTQEVCISDLRVWSVAKTLADFEQVHYHQPQPTAVLHFPSTVPSLNHQDRHAFKVLPNGLIKLAEPLPVVRRESQVRVRRYDSTGRYVGDPRFNEVGLGGGTDLPAVWQLGREQQYLLSATGTTVVSGTHGWAGTNAIFHGSGTATRPPWSVTGADEVYLGNGNLPLPWFNPAVDKVWIAGDSLSDGTAPGAGSGNPVYEIEVVAVGTQGSLRASRLSTVALADQPSGAITLVSSGTDRISVDSYGVPCVRTGISLDLPPAFLYAHSLLLEDAPDVLAVTDSWPDTRWETPSTFGLALGKAVLPGNGLLSFSNGQTGVELATGDYRLILDVSNHGQVDQEFDGFNVEISVGDTILQRRLLVGRTGTNFRGTEEIQFALATPLSGEYSLEINVLNAQHDNTRGTSRRLVVHGYTLRKLATQLFRVTVASGAIQVSKVDTTVYGSGTGAWRVTMSSNGTVVGWQHESQHTAPGAHLPAASLLTSSTAFRREDHVVTGTLSGSAVDYRERWVSPFDAGNPVLIVS